MTFLERLGLKRLASVPGQERPVFRKLELHVAHCCNLSCESCSHYSNHAHAGIVSLEDADRWMGLWSGRVSVTRFSLLGGEPTIHPELPRLVGVVRNTGRAPKSRSSATASSILAADPMRAWSSPSITWRRNINRSLPCCGNGGATTALSPPAHKNWTRRYDGFGDTMLPFDDGDPRASWEACPARHCKQVLDGCIWKCAPLAYLPMQKAKYRLSEKWDPYLGYQPPEPDCSPAELQAFAALEDEAECGMCPAKERLFELPIPLRPPKPLAIPAV